jgi:hypothetical protein
MNKVNKNRNKKYLNKKTNHKDNSNRIHYQKEEI